MKKLFTHIGCLLLIAIFILPKDLKAENGQMMFIATLSGFEEVPQVSTAGQALITFLFSEDRKEMFIHGVFTNLSGPALACHIHVGSQGVAGPVVIDLTSLISGNRIKGTMPVPSGDFYENAVNYQLYVNVHTADNPDGEIRGQLTWMTDMIFPVIASAVSQVPPIASNAIGLGTLRFSQNLTIMEYQFLPVGLSGPVIAAHIHNGMAGENGPVLAPLNAGDFITGTINDVALVRKIFIQAYQDSAYLNVHTTANPNGEIRGQLLIDWPNNGGTLLNGDQETPAVSSTAKAYGYASLDLPKLDSINYVVVYSGIVPTAAHIHSGKAGVAGSVIVPLEKANTPGAYFGKAAISDVDVSSFLKDDLYFNIHSTAHPTGEIRGQIQNNLLKSFAFDLCGDQEVPKNNTKGYGAAFAAVNKSNTEITYGLLVDGLSGEAIAAHIHDGIFGVSGPVLLGLQTPKPFDDYYYLPITGVLGGKIDIDGAYMNVHTSANPNGEIRGQMRRSLSCAINVATIQSSLQDILLSTTLVRDLLILKANSDKNVVTTIYVSDISGKQLIQWQHKSFVAGSNKINLDVEKLSSGFYLLNVIDEHNSIRSFKFVKQ